MSNNLSINILVSMFTAVVVSIAVSFVLQSQVFSERISTADDMHEIDFEMSEPVLEGGEISDSMSDRAIALQREIQSVGSAISAMSEFLQSAEGASITEGQREEFIAEMNAQVEKKAELEAEYEALFN